MNEILHKNLSVCAYTLGLAHGGLPLIIQQMEFCVGDKCVPPSHLVETLQNAIEQLKLLNRELGRGIEEVFYNPTQNSFNGHSQDEEDDVSAN
jgi:hypothetical protein